jgi:hypothetical protein
MTCYHSQPTPSTGKRVSAPTRSCSVHGFLSLIHGARLPVVFLAAGFLSCLAHAADASRGGSGITAEPRSIHAQVLDSPEIGTTAIAPRLPSDQAQRPQWAVALYRIYRTDNHSHFYTALLSEREHVLSEVYDGIWQAEGISHYVSSSEIKGSQPVYRLYNRWTGTHFYTINEEELDIIITNLSDRWELEGVAFFAMDRPVAGTVPVYRFYFWESRSHFYTTSEEERDWIIVNHPSTPYPDSYPVRYEGVAWYAWP